MHGLTFLKPPAHANFSVSTALCYGNPDWDTNENGKKLLTLFILAGLAGFAGNAIFGAEESLPALENGKAPQTIEEMWAGYDPRKEPLETEVLKQWEQDGVVLRVVRYRIGIFKGQKSMMAAVYGFPKGGANLPGLVQVHGGGQSANLNAVISNAKRGYACISLNWVANRLGVPDYSGTNTDWGAVDATQNGHNSHYTSLEPDTKTIDTVKSGRNNNWFLLTSPPAAPSPSWSSNPRSMGACSASMAIPWAPTSPSTLPTVTHGSRP